MNINVKEESKAFFVCNGHVLKSLQDLDSELEGINEADFLYHVNNEKNDFYNWIRIVLNDRKLASMLKRVKSRSMTVKKIKLRIKMLEARIGR